ncbi:MULTISPECIES: LytR/AlgR family response regulator transcription factor [Flavobacterium]|uniref:DNA-binding response regulator n=1 Tax=Flavobacterium chungangense TaxID=554283 RepID=A0A6V6YZ59_9FLAO|nr:MULTISPECIES: response regulator transcription factor [Flavobacterium]CAD0004817.1 DNA-binding response regulator [Flavobacterium chungangense]
MDNINVLIIEDIPSESDALIKGLQANNYTIAGLARNHKDALSLFYNNKVDIVIIDIFLNGSPDGLAFAESINAVPNASKPFVFLTSSTDRKIFERAKLTKPFSYLMKPFNELELLYALELAVEKFYAQDDVFLSEEENTVISKEYLFIKKGKSLKKVDISDIIYIEVEEKYCNIITEKEKFIILISLTKILELFDSTVFCRTHRNFIVNTKKMTEIIPADNLIILQGNHRVILSDKYKDIISKTYILK